MTDRSTAPSAAAAAAAPQPPTAELLVLSWPEMFGLGPAQGGAAVPGRQMYVDPKLLAPRLLGAVLADLAASGVVRLDVATTKVLRVTRQHVVVTRTGAPGPADGFAGQLLAQVAGAEKVRKVVRGWYGKDVANPFLHVVERVAREGHLLGYYREEPRQQGRVAAALRLRSRATYSPIVERIGSTREAAVALAGRLRSFAQASPGLIPMLEHDVASAIKSRAAGESDSEIGGGGEVGGFESGE